MEINLNDKYLNNDEKKEIYDLLSLQNPELTNDLEQIWYLMDYVWDELGCNNKNLEWDKISRFYAHPVWLLNGLFIEQDETSMAHRHAISNWIVKKQFKTILDYGGGFGTLARLIGEKNPKIKIDIYEPHPNPLAKKKIDAFNNINFLSSISDQYDCLVSTDVLEHVPDPLTLLAKMINCVKPYGFLIIANNFHPVIKCHLPSTFHLRYTFSIFTKLMNLRTIGQFSGSHAYIYVKKNSCTVNWNIIRFIEKFSYFSFPVLELLHKIYKKAKGYNETPSF